MKYFVFIIVGLVGGIIGGMGMGGGTLLIPLLTICLNVEQKLAQTINLMAFIPMSIVVIFMQAKKKNIVFKEVLWIALPALLTSIASAYCVKFVSSEGLRQGFGGFLIILAVIMSTAEIIKYVHKRRDSRLGHDPNKSIDSQENKEQEKKDGQL